MKIPVALVVAPLERCPVWLRTLGYCGALVALLSWLSYRLVWSNPDQVRRRLLEALEPLTSGSVDVGRARLDPEGGARVDRVDLHAPRELGGGLLLGLRGVRLLAEPAPGETSFETGRGRKLRDEVEPGGRSPATVRVEECEVRLDRVGGRPASSAAGGDGREAGEPAGRDGRWLPLEVLQGEAIVEALRRHPLDLRVLRGQCTFSLEAPGGGREERSFSVVDLVARSDARAAFLDFELPAAEDWAEGFVEASLARGGDRVRLHAAFDSFAGADRWVRFLPRPWRSAWRALRIEGTFDVDVELSGRAGSTAVEGRVLLDHLDSRLRLGAAGPELLHWRGRMVLDGEGLALGDEAGVAPGTGELWGLAARASGRVAERGGEARVQLVPVDARQVAAADLPAPLGAVVAFLRPAGRIEGTVTARLPAGGLEAGGLEVVVRLADLRPAVWRGARLVDGRLSVSLPEGEGARIGTLELSGLAWEGAVGPVTGKIALVRDGERLRFDTRDGSLRVRAPPGLAPNLPGGSIDVKGSLEPSGALGELSLSWRGLALGCPLATARSSDGAMAWSPASARAADGEAESDGEAVSEAEPEGGAKSESESSGESEAGVAGSAEIRGITVREGLLEASAVDFTEGRLRWRVRAGGVDFSLVRCRSPGLALRAYGRVSLGGEVDFRCLVASGEEAAALEALADDAPVRSWVDATGPSGGGATIWRWRGPLRALEATRIDASDFLFDRPYPIAPRG